MTPYNLNIPLLEASYEDQMNFSMDKFLIDIFSKYSFYIIQKYHLCRYYSFSKTEPEILGFEIENNLCWPIVFGKSFGVKP